MKDLDKRDRKILTILADNPRITYSELSKYLHLSKNATKYRLDRLTRLQILWKVHPVINYEKLGLITYEVFLKCSADEEKRKELNQYLSTQKNMLWSTAVFGAYDYFLEILVRSPEELDAVMIEIIHLLGDSFREFKTFIATRRLKIQPLVAELKEEIPEWKSPPKQKINLEPTTLDKLDKLILKSLCNDGRKSYYDIAKELKTTLQTVRNRVRKLIQNTTIEDFKQIYGYDKLGYVRYILLIRTRLTNRDQEDKLRNFFNRQGAIKLVLHLVNTNELELFVAVKHPSDLEQLILDMKNEFPKQVVDVEFMHLTKEFRLNFFPEGL